MTYNTQEASIAAVSRLCKAICTCTYSNTETSSTLYNVNPNCPVHALARAIKEVPK